MTAKQFLENVGIPKGKSEESLTAFAEEYAKYKATEFVEAISRNPITCYSQKVSGQEKQFFLGRDYVERLKDAIQKTF